MDGNTPKVEQINERVLVLLGLEDEFELSYEEYIRHLKEALATISLGKSRFSTEEAMLLQEEFKRVKGKKKTDRFKPQKKKITAQSFGVGKKILSPVQVSKKSLFLPPSKSSADIGGGDSSGTLARIDTLLESILGSLTLQNKEEKKRSEKQRKDEENKRRASKERKLESKPFEAIKKAVDVVTKPFRSLFDIISNFLFNVILGRIVVKLIGWFGDPQNQDKIKSLIRFFTDHWPTLLALYLRFGTGIGRFVGRLGGILIKGAFKLGALAAKLAAKVGLKGAGKFAKFLGGRKGKALATGLGIAADVAVTAGTAVGIGGLASGDFKLPGFAGGGFNSGFKNFFGNMFSGLVKGPKGRDRVPAMLTDGEFVMSAGAVKKYGVDTLESMNAAGGGTNIPQITDGMTYAAGGGFIGKTADYLKHDEALSSLTKGANDFIKPGGKSVVTAKSWDTVKPQTPVHSYIDSVGQPTIGWGSTFYDSILNGKKPVKPGDTITKSQADQILNVNIMNLAKTYSQKIPMWNKMSDDQKAGVLLVGYNAPYGPIGSYPNLTKSLQSGNMVSAAENAKRGGPSPSRIALEKRLILSGPKDLSKATTKVEEKKEKKSGPNIFQRLLQGIPSMMSGFKKPKSTEFVKSKSEDKYADGGHAPRMSQFTPVKPKPKTKNNITPLPRRKTSPSSIENANMSSLGGGMRGSKGSSAVRSVPSFAANHGKINTAVKTLGINRR